MARTGLTERVEARLKELNLSMRKASLSVSTNPDLFRGALRNENPEMETLVDMARALGWTVEELIGSEAPAPRSDSRSAEFVRADGPLPCAERDA